MDPTRWGRRRRRALAMALGDRLGELDCNPVVVTADGAYVVDSLVVLAADPAERGPFHE
ncbi:MAG: hypothetical protein ACE367_21870 [Acidimicrobiales bacterium]